MIDYFPEVIEANGKITASAPVPPADIDALAALMPANYINFIRSYGKIVWQNGRFQTVNPLEWTAIVDSIFAGEREFSPASTFMLGYGATGILSFWNREHNQPIDVELPQLKAVYVPEKSGPGRPEIGIIGAVPDSSFNYFDLLDPNTGKPVLKSILKTHGALKCGEVLGYFPALALGGSGALDTLRKVSALEHFALLASMGEITLFHSEGGVRRRLRVLGSG